MLRSLPAPLHGRRGVLDTCPPPLLVIQILPKKRKPQSTVKTVTAVNNIAVGGRLPCRQTIQSWLHRELTTVRRSFWKSRPAGLKYSVHLCHFCTPLWHRYRPGFLPKHASSYTTLARYSTDTLHGAPFLLYFRSSFAAIYRVKPRALCGRLHQPLCFEA